jgi:hypothetical protein
MLVNRFAVTIYSSIVISGALVGCASSSNLAKPSYNQTNTSPINEADNATNVANASTPPVGPNSITTNQITNQSTENTSSQHSDGIHFAPYIVRAMEQARQTTKMSALFAPTEPIFQPHVPFVGVKEYASDWIYSISLFSTTTAVPINDPSLDKLPNNAGLGMFRGTDYFDHHQAMEDFASQFKVDKVGPPAKVDANGVMKQYQTGQQYILNGSTNYTSPQNVLEWQEGKWTIDVFGAPSLDFINTAKQVASFLQSHELPPTDGRIIINPDLKGKPITKIGWVFGDTFYVCESSSMMNALDMAVSMREYDNYNVVP